MQVAEKEAVFELVQQIEGQISRVILGQDELIRNLLIGLFAKIPYSFKQDEGEKSGCGHVLLEGVPGLAKTLAIMTLARSISARFQRIQCTPDLLPSDILGTRIFDVNTNTFQTEKGPIFANIVLADEINRATPKTQSALLEAMQERQVTIGENSYPLDRPFWLLATQNPLEQEGVYVLPEAQVDRFAMKVVVDYPPSEEEARVLANPLSEISIDAVIQPEDILQVQETISRIHVDSRVHRYIVALGRATRVDGSGPPSLKGLVLSGVSTRAFQHVLALVRVIAFLEHRDFVLPEDVKAIAVESMQHRIIRSVHAEAEGVTGGDIINEVLEYVPIP